MNARQKLDQFLDWRDKHRPSIKSVAVNVRTETFRRYVGASKAEQPLVYRNTVVRCLGSAPWKRKNPMETA
jgi:hypothetical protein